MKREWPRGLPFDGVCTLCRLPLARGTRFHECGRVTPAIAQTADRLRALRDRFGQAQMERR